MLKHFKMDAARWIIQQQVSDPERVTLALAIKLFLRYLPLQAMFWFRVGTWLKKKNLPFAGMIQRMIYRSFGLEIVMGTDIGGGLYIAHPIGTVIAVEKMGENCTIIANVTLGMRNEWTFPRIGNNVFIGAGARVLGDIEIGDGAVIGANAVVINDVPAGATAVGIPARVIKRNGERVEAEMNHTAESMQPFEGMGGTVVPGV